VAGAYPMELKNVQVRDGGCPDTTASGGKIEKLRPGIYADKNLPLRLVIDSAGSRKWIFRFIWRSTVHDMTLGGSELSLAMARELATKASRKFAAGQNPIDGSWSSIAMQSLKSKS
jgi:hypothetical protein